jgi:hypothetical protein
MAGVDAMMEARFISDDHREGQAPSPKSDTDRISRGWLRSSGHCHVRAEPRRIDVTGILPQLEIGSYVHFCDYW